MESVTRVPLVMLYLQRIKFLRGRTISERKGINATDKVNKHRSNSEQNTFFTHPNLDIQSHHIGGYTRK